MPNLINQMTIDFKKNGEIIKKPDVVIFEGWCVGAKPQKKKIYYDL